jgi:hypothetical protein
MERDILIAQGSTGNLVENELEGHIKNDQQANDHTRFIKRRRSARLRPKRRSVTTRTAVPDFAPRDDQSP